MSSIRRQHGSTLITGLVMLVVLTLMVLSAINSGNSNLRIAGNMQTKEEAVAAGQQAIEGYISYNFTANPVASSVAIDINSDNTADYQVAVSQPACTSTVPIPVPQLNPFNPADSQCLLSSAPIGGIITASNTMATSSTSLCYQQNWDIQANVSSLSQNGAAVVLHQGVNLRVQAGTVCPQLKFYAAGFESRPCIRINEP